METPSCHALWGFSLVIFYVHKGNLDGVLIMDPQLFDGFISFFKLPFDLHIFSRIMIDFHDTE